MQLKFSIPLPQHLELQMYCPPPPPCFDDEENEVLRDVKSPSGVWTSEPLIVLSRLPPHLHGSLALY